MRWSPARSTNATPSASRRSAAVDDLQGHRILDPRGSAALAENLTEFRPRLTTIDQITASTVRGWDPDSRQAIVGRVENGNGTPDVG